MTRTRVLFAFIHIPKTAGSTLETILRQSFCSRHCDVRVGDDFNGPLLTAEVLRRTRWVYPRLASIAGHSVRPHGDLQAVRGGVRYYTLLREPVVRCASEYQFRVQRDGLPDDFGRWIHSGIARNRQTKMLAGVEDADAAIEMLRAKVGLVGLVERFNESLVLLRRWFDDPRLDIRYRSKNVTADNRLKRGLLNDPRSRRLLDEANREDRRLYDYVAAELYPAQVRAYGEAARRPIRGNWAAC